MTSKTKTSQWVRLQDGDRFVGDLWSRFDGRQRRETLGTALWSGEVRMRARFSAKCHHPEGQLLFPRLERHGVLGTSTPLLDIQQLFLRIDPRLQTWDIPAGRIVISRVYDDKTLWGGVDWESFFPGGVTIPTGRFLTIELDDIEFDGRVARAYIVKNLLPTDEGASPEQITPQSTSDRREAYVERVAVFRDVGDVPPLDTTKKGIQGDRQWATERGISRTDIEKWRAEMVPDRRRGRRPNNPAK